MLLCLPHIYKKKKKRKKGVNGTCKTQLAHNRRSFKWFCRKKIDTNKSEIMYINGCPFLACPPHPLLSPTPPSQSTVFTDVIYYNFFLAL